MFLSIEKDVKTSRIKVVELESESKLVEHGEHFKMQRGNCLDLYIEFVVLECRVKLQHDWSLKRWSHLFVVEQVPEIHQYWKSNLVEIHWRNIHSQNHLRLVDSFMEPNHLFHIFFVNIKLRVLLIESVVCLFLVWFECQRKTIRNFNDLPVNAT